MTTMNFRRTHGPREHFGRNLKAYRELSGISHFDFVAEAQLDPRQLLAIEAGQANPVMETLERISLAINLPLSTLFEEQPVTETNFPLEKYQPAFNQLSREEQIRALAILRLLCRMSEVDESLIPSITSP